MSEPGFLIRALWRGWWLVLLALVAALAVAWWITAGQAPVYSAEALLVVTPSSELDSNDELLDSIEALERRTLVATFARLPRSPEIRDKAAERMQVEPASLRYYWVGGSVLPSTNIVRIEVIGEEPQVAADFANALATSTRREARRLYKLYSMREMARAEPPRRPLRPDLRRNLAVGALLGLALGLLAAAALEALRGGRVVPAAGDAG